ncbi:hypothetical protein A0H81_13890 [Grifola frondosa]|uniref:Uncharacterized protein n=1 Tax=Grifola frondosa TaxID=5627 RepID=A0A1C7LQG2_GRIFR|nr:hypothetical protein A0H81_13890 [Grifola frondosa]
MEAFIPHSLGIPTDWHASISVSTAIPTLRFIPLLVECGVGIDAPPHSVLPRSDPSAFAGRVIFGVS